ncbi:substrate-binding domain-containing protein [Aeromonas media]|uniref:substrate-binding domain-containing protein n=1 Tax=Aeromonas media TaxID=651 RepID=UPI003D052559
MREAYEQTRQLLAFPNTPDAVFCCSDYMTQGCYQAIAEAGLRIPEDILVAGHDNQMLANEMVPLCLLDAPNEIHKATHDFHLIPVPPRHFASVPSPALDYTLDVGRR